MIAVILAVLLYNGHIEVRYNVSCNISNIVRYIANDGISYNASCSL